MVVSIISFVVAHYVLNQIFISQTQTKKVHKIEMNLN